MVRQISAIRLVSNLDHFLDALGVARDGVTLLAMRLANQSGEAAQRSIKQKLERIVDEESKSVRMQVCRM